jgi:TolA-binding protein
MNRKAEILSPFFIDTTNLPLRKNQFGHSHFLHPETIHGGHKAGVPSGLAMYLIPLLFMLILSEFNCNSQMPFTISESGSEFNRAMELFNKEKYPAAIRLFDSYVAEGSHSALLKVSEAQYYSALASVSLFNSDAEFRMLNYILEHPESPKLNEARLALGDYFYQVKNYRKAVSYYETVNRQELGSEKLTEYFFRLGYSLYIKGDKDKALLMFSEIKDIDTDYTPPAIYYYSQIAYEKQMYQTALEGFKRLTEDETFGQIVPFYIVQILYIQKDYDGILAIAPGLLDSAAKERATELYRFIGDAYYNKGMYAEALPYLEKYRDSAKLSQREEKYQLGYCYYKTGATDKAIKLLLEVDAVNDILSQNSWNVLGDCYLLKSDKKRAQYAFGQAAKLDFDKTLREESLFNYAKLTYELSYSPFGEAIASFQEYIDRYPGSARIQEVYDYLVETLMQAKNYSAALSALDRIPEKDSKLEQAYQRVAFFRGLQLFKNLEIEASIDMFEKSLKYQKYSRMIMARTYYWKGEALYRLSDFQEAKDDYEKFIGIPGSSRLAENNLVLYNLAYTCFNLKDYSTSLTHLLNFESSPGNAAPEIVADARNRIADCYYVATSYQQAINYYNRVIASGSPNADYAMFRKGFCMGLMNDERGKVDVLTSLMSKYPSSSTTPEALFERGRAYTVLEDFQHGEEDFNTIISGFPSTPFVPMAMVQLGLIYYNKGENEKAISQYKKVIENYGSTPEARNAMTGLKNTYVEMNDVEKYFAYVKTIGGYGDVNTAEKDSLVYNSGENLYTSGKYDKAAETFKNYLGEFPNGTFRSNAQFYLAESLRTAGNKEEALKYYTDVTNEPGNQFLEQSLIISASMMFENEDYTSALGNYEKLENVASNDANKLTALRGQLRSAYEEGDAAKTITAASKIGGTPNVPEELVRAATFMKAKANYSLNKFDEALSDFRKVAKEVTSAEGAESKYRVAELLNKQDKPEESERVITEFIDQKSPHQFWMARMFLLLADISIKKGDGLQARATLQSLKDYYTVTDDGILDEVKTRLDKLDEKK